MKLIKAIVPNAIVFHTEDCPEREEGSLTFEEVEMSKKELGNFKAEEGVEIVQHSCLG